jgi:cation diffusion facilitator CzcD-associated flavoprotein CzcO
MHRQTFNGQVVDDVLIIGAGMAGLTLAAALSHVGIHAVLLDKAPCGFEGPWLTTARMETLRSPKELAGPALGIGSLTFKAWHVAQFGEADWQAMDKIPRAQWAQYLQWYRQVLKLDVHNDQEVIHITPVAAHMVRVTIQDRSGNKGLHERHARRVILATGRDGLGGPSVPEWARDLPRERWVHSADHWMSDRFKGLRVAVIGAGASAMDSAATALEHGASQVDLLIRRVEMPRINKSKGSGSPGMAHGFWRLPDEWKWRIRHYINAQQVPPPRNSTLRVSKHPQAHFHLGTSVQRAQVQNQHIVLSTSKGDLVCDAIIFSTGFRNDWASRPEFSSFADHVRIWKDRFDHPSALEDEELSESPDLGDHFQFQPKPGLEMAGLDHIHCFNYAATLSQGAVAGDIPQISDGAQRLAKGLAAMFLHEDIDHHFAKLQAYSDPELLGDEWVPAAFPSPQSQTDREP